MSTSDPFWSLVTSSSIVRYAANAVTQLHPSDEHYRPAAVIWSQPGVIIARPAITAFYIEIGSLPGSPSGIPDCRSPSKNRICSSGSHL